MAGIDRDSDILVDQILAWDNSLFRREIGLLPEALCEEVQAALREFFDLEGRRGAPCKRGTAGAMLGKSAV